MSAIYDFENRLGIFPDVDGRFKFSVLLMNGADVPRHEPRFVFFAHKIEDLRDKARQITLTTKELKLLNPTTRTSPIFRTNKDAELTKRVYRTIPILMDRARTSGGNPWEFSPWTMFHQAGDAQLFTDGEDLEKQGFKLEGAIWRKGIDRYLPLYEAKMIQAFDHRAASVMTADGNWLRHGQTQDATLVEHQNPEFAGLSRWWVGEGEVMKTKAGPKRWGFVGFKDISSATN